MAKKSVDEVFEDMIHFLDPETKSVFANDLCFISSISVFGLYREGVYDLLNNDEMEKAIYKRMRSMKEQNVIDDSVPISKAFVENMRRMLPYSTIKTVHELPMNMVAFADKKVLDLNKNPFDESEWNRNNLAFLKVPHDLEEIRKSDCPKFKAFLASMLVHKDGTTPNYELYEWMQLFLGYLVLPSLNGQCVFFLVGERAANGKSSFMDIVQQLFNPKSISAMSIEELSRNNFAVGSLRGKRLNVGDEEESAFVSSSLFKKIVSGDILDADVKFEGRIQFRNRAKFVFMTNSNPTFKNYDQGVQRRFYFVPFNKCFENDPARRNKDDMIADILTELPGIWNFALEGAKKVIELEYKIPKIKEMIEAQEEFEYTIKSSYEFMHENYVVSSEFSEDFVLTKTLYDQYQKWCLENGSQPMKRNNFATELKRKYEREGLDKRSKWIDGQSCQAFFGLREVKGQDSFVETSYPQYAD